MKRRILCIEDDKTMQTMVEVSLPEFTVVPAGTIQEAETLLAGGEFQALVVDIELPDGDGLKFLTRISQNESWKKIPVIMLSGHAEISNKVRAFTFGADDFLAKPFDPLELNARVSAKVRKSQAGAEEAQARKIGDLLIDFGRQKAFRASAGRETDLGLTSLELKLLALLTKRLEQVYSRDQIMTGVWGETFITDRTVDSHVAHLRQKISGSSLEIETVKNLGYCARLKK